jgi:hypothetical protein
LNFEYLTFRNCYGGFAITTSTTVSLAYVTFYNNTVALTATGSYLGFSSCTIYNSTATNAANGLQLSNSNGILQDSVFSGITGSALNLVTSSFTVGNCSFYDNFAAVNGSALYANESTMVMTDCHMYNNTVNGEGTVYLVASTMNVSGLLLHDNESPANFAGFVALNSNVTMTNCQLLNSRGGAKIVGGVTAQLQGSSFSGHSGNQGLYLGICSLFSIYIY